MLVLGAALAMALADDDEVKALPNGAGKQAMVKVCLECHGASHIRGQRLSQEVWTDKVYDMVDRGAKGTDEEIAAVVAYLTKNFGKDSKVVVNTAPLIELHSVLGFTVAESEAVAAYRKDHAAFAEWRDLLKVPGMDAARVEAARDLMAF